MDLLVSKFFESEYFNEAYFGAPKDSDNYDIDCGIHATDYHTGQPLADFSTIRDAARWAWEDTDCPKMSKSRTLTNLNCKNILDAACGMEDRDDKDAPRGSAYGCKWEIDNPEYLSDDRAESYLVYHGKFSRSHTGRQAAQQYIAQKKAEKQAAIDAEIAKEQEEKRKRQLARQARLAAQRAEEDRLAKEKWEREAPERERKAKFAALVARQAEIDKKNREATERPYKDYVKAHVGQVLKSITRPMNREGDSIMDSFGCDRTWGWPRRGLTLDFKDAIWKADERLRSAIRRGTYRGEEFSLYDYYKNLEKVAHSLGLDESIQSDNLVDKFFESEY